MSPDDAGRDANRAAARTKAQMMLPERTRVSPWSESQSLRPKQLSCNRQPDRLRPDPRRVSKLLGDMALELSHRPKNGTRGVGLASIGLVALAMIFFCPPIALAQDDPEPNVSDYVNDQPEISREEWRQRVEQAKQRAKEVARERREHPELYMPIPEDPEKIASERVLNDDSLRNGDIVSTKNGLFLFRGHSDQPRSGDDFVPLSPK